MWQATTLVSVLRGTTTDVYGDEVDNDTVSASGIPASILEQRRQVTDPASGMARTVSFYTGRVPAGTDVRESDRVRDERTSIVYVVSGAPSVGATLVATTGLRLDLKRVSG